MDAYSLKELQIDIAMLDGDPDTNLELAASIGKLLLEKNEELECRLQEYREKVEDQQQEIWNLTRQTKALHEVNDSRIKIYEQLEVNIEELERANHQLVVQNINEQELVRNLKESIKILEVKCLELQETINCLNGELEASKAKSADVEREFKCKHPVQFNTIEVTTSRIIVDSVERAELKAEIRSLVEQLEGCQARLREDQVKMERLEEQLGKLVVRNNDLEDQVAAQVYAEDIEVSNRSLCDGCTSSQQPSLFDEIEEDDNILEELDSECVSIYEGYYPPALSTPKPKATLLRELIEKYEAVLELHKNKTIDEDNTSCDSGIKSVSPTFSSSGTSSPNRSGSTSPSLVFTDKTTQTEPDFIYNVDDVKVEIYKNGKKLRTKLCNKHKCKRLFREFLATLEECSGDEDDEPSEENRATADPSANLIGRHVLPPQQKLAAKENSVSLTPKKKKQAKKVAVITEPEVFLIESTSTINDSKQEPTASKSEPEVESTPSTNATTALKPEPEVESTPSTNATTTSKPEPEVESTPSSNATTTSKPAPLLIPYIRESIDDFIPKKKSSKKKRADCTNPDKPILVGVTGTAKAVEIPINFHYEQHRPYRKSPASKNLSMLKKMETSYSALLKKTETQPTCNHKHFYRK